MKPNPPSAPNTTSADGARDVDLYRLLGRPRLPIDEPYLARELAGKRVLITGAGGSIGTRLATKLLDWQVSEAVLLDNHEHSLYELGLRLPETPGRHLYLADVRQGRRLRTIFERHRPEVVFHLAAYKHVPLGEANPGEVFSVNVLGALAAARAAHATGAGRFVYTSTDKAVYPPSVYGAGKRMVELLLLGLRDEQPDTNWTVVRLVNAMGAQGGVIKLFARQIAGGRPLTITHEGMTRYWISIEEATLLVAMAACMEDGPAMVAPDAGDPIPLTVIAQRLRDLVRPGSELAFTVTGLRPGERLEERLIRDDEEILPASQPGVVEIRRRARPGRSFDQLASQVGGLEDLAERGDEGTLRRRLFELVRF